MSRMRRLSIVVAVLAAGAEGGRATDLTGLGANGLQVKPYTWTGAAADDECVYPRVAGWVLRDLCADDDGCRLRLVTDHPDHRLAWTEHTSVIAADLGVWSLSDVEWGALVSTNGNGHRQVLLTVPYPDSTSCILVDDLDGETDPWFVLEVCAGPGRQLSCTLRVDD